MIEEIILLAVSTLFGYVVYILKDMRKESKEKEERLEQQKIEKEKQDQAVGNGLKCLLRQNIIDYHDKYTERGYITPHGHENLQEMMETYERLGGNGTVKKMAVELNKLPIRDRGA